MSYEVGKRHESKGSKDLKETGLAEIQEGGELDFKIFSKN